MSVHPRFGDAPRRGLAPASAEEVARLMRRTGIVAALLVAWALAGTIAAVAPGADGVALGVSALPFAILALVAFLLDRRTPTPAKSALAAAAGTIALALALAGHVLFWGGFHRALFLLTVPAGARWGIFVGVLLLVPLYAGARLRALSLAWNASGSRARGPGATIEAIARTDDLLGPVPWRTAWQGALARWAEGLRLPGLLLLDSAARATRPADVLAADASLDALAEALAANGAHVDKRQREIAVKVSDQHAPLRISLARLRLPAGPAIEVRGDLDGARKLRRILEGAASYALVFARSAPGRRWERRVNSLHREALVASTLEERSLVMEELDRVRKALTERDLCGEELAILMLKEETARAMLAHRMLSEPPGARVEPRVLSQHGAMAPQLARVMDAGGLDAVKRVAFVPHWIVPVRTRWGEQEVAVSAATGKVDLGESRTLLDTMRRRGPVLFLDVGAQAVFLPAPPATNALLRELRAAGLTPSDDLASAADIVYVPFLATAEGYVSGVTGAAAADLGSVVPIAPS